MPPASPPASRSDATAEARPSRRWRAATVLLCSLGGVTPFAQALELLGVAAPGGPALGAQAATALVWAAASGAIARRWSLAESEAGALGGLGLLTLAVTGAASALVLVALQPPSPYGWVSSWMVVALGWLPTHAVTAGMLSLVGSWTSGRRQRARAAAREAALSAAAARAELEALRTRLQPHFLLNALNAVAGLARAGDGERAGEVAADLGELLRFALAESGDAVPFDAEREIIERYLAIEQARLGDRLVVAWALDRAARTARLPALVWQPLVENAVRHGIARRTTPGCLTLSARRTNSALVLVVDADGADGHPGTDAAPAGALAPARDPAADLASAPFGGLGLGLSTVERRLALLYGGRARLSVAARPGGVRAELSLPLDDR
jgi:hypothetical protein